MKAAKGCWKVAKGRLEVEQTIDACRGKERDQRGQSQRAIAIAKSQESELEPRARVRARARARTKKPRASELGIIWCSKPIFFCVNEWI